MCFCRCTGVSKVSVFVTSVIFKKTAYTGTVSFSNLYREHFSRLRKGSKRLSKIWINLHFFSQNFSVGKHMDVFLGRDEAKILKSRNARTCIFNKSEKKYDLLCGRCNAIKTHLKFCPIQNSDILDEHKDFFVPGIAPDETVSTADVEPSQLALVGALLALQKDSRKRWRK